MKKVDLSTYNNSWYSPGGFFKRACWYFISLFFFKSANPINFLKIFLLRLFGAQVGTGVVVKPHVNIKYPWLLKIGNNTWLGEKVWIDNLGEINIGSNVCLSQGACLITGNHNYKNTSFDLIVKPIVLEDGAWVGARATVCPGVVMHSHAVLTVGSVANNHLEAYSIYSGVPAVKIKSRDIA